MFLRFQRWNLIDAEGRVTAVLRLVEDGELLTDPGHQDCFTNTAAAAEAAWLVSQGPPPRGTWLQAADVAMDSEPVDAIGPADRPLPRRIDPDLVAHGDVKWLADLAGQSLAGTISFDKLPAAGVRQADQSGADALDAFLTSDDEEDTAPLSGQATREWALADFAGVATSSPKPPPQDDGLGTVSDGPLSGRATKEWDLVDLAGVATGRKRDPEE